MRQSSCNSIFGIEGLARGEHRPKDADGSPCEGDDGLVVTFPLLNQAAEMAVDGDKQYMREVAKSDQDLQRTIDQIELSRVESSRSDREEDRNQKADLIEAGRRNGGAPGGFQGAAEAEQHRDPIREARSTPEQDDQMVEQQAMKPSFQRTKHSDDLSIEKKPALDAEFARSVPPQQHVPRLRQIELELEEHQDRDRDDRER